MLSLYDPVPGYPTGVWRENARESYRTADSKKSISSLVTGPNRCKFFKRPVTPPYRTKESNMPKCSLYVGYLIEPESHILCTVGTQTDYRESESQTEPWNPPFALRKIFSDPEILTISELTYGNGLPIISEEVEILTRAREKKRWELTLPPLYGDIKDWKKRQRLIAEKEKEEWQFRMRKMKEMQDVQLQQMEMCLEEQLHAHEQRNLILLERLNDTKVANSFSRRLKARSKLSQSIQLVEKMHIISSKRNNHDTAHKITEKAPPTQNETRRRALNDQINSVASSFYLTNPKGMEQLEEWLFEEGDMSMNPEIYLPERDPRPNRYEKLLQGAHEDILGSKCEKLPITPPEIKIQMERVKYRIPTPSVPTITQDVLDRDYSALIFQSVLRGRAIQKEVSEGTMRNFDLIDELRYSHATNVEAVSGRERSKNNILFQYIEQKKKAEKAAVFNEALARLEGKAASDLLNILGKEVSRNHECRRIQDMISSVKEERRKKEAEESGRRQQEFQCIQVMEDLFQQRFKDQRDAINELSKDIIIDVTNKDEDSTTKNDS